MAVLGALISISIEILKEQCIHLFHEDFDMVAVPHEIAKLTLIRKDEY